MALVGMDGPVKLRAYTKSRKFTYQTIGNIIGVAEQTVTQWGSGAQRPRLKMRYILQELSGVSPEDWLTGPEKEDIAKAIQVIDDLRRAEPVEGQSLRDRLAGRI